MLEQPLVQLMRYQRPDCLVADMFFPWATLFASKFAILESKFAIPRIVFHGTCFFSLCAAVIRSLHKPHKKVSSDSELFVIPNFPDEIQLTRNQIPNYTHPYIDKLLKEGKESELTSYGVVVNSFCELEPAYADHFRKNLGRKAWHIGPVSLCKKDNEDKAWRGKEAAIDEHQCLKWLHPQFSCLSQFWKWGKLHCYSANGNHHGSGIFWATIHLGSDEETQKSSS